MDDIETSLQNAQLEDDTARGRTEQGRPFIQLAPGGGGQKGAAAGYEDDVTPAYGGRDNGGSKSQKGEFGKNWFVLFGPLTVTIVYY